MLYIASLLICSRCVQLSRCALHAAICLLITTATGPTDGMTATFGSWCVIYVCERLAFQMYKEPYGLINDLILYGCEEVVIAGTSRPSLVVVHLLREQRFSRV